MDLPPVKDKPYYRIGEVARLLGVGTHVLRYWESEFPQVQPIRAPSGHRLYHRHHIELLVLVQRLVHVEGLTIAGAKKRLEQMSLAPAEAQKSPADPPADPGQLAQELRDILKLIS